MTDWSIRVENLSKAYRIGLKEQRHETLVGAGLDFLRSPVKNLRRLRRLTDLRDAGTDSEDVIWALHDVSFEVPEGGVLGIVGANGAGKTTLLKVLSGITEPTIGRAFVKGRVSSLLEVGTGFHPDLTGRENIYLNGTILGMTKAEVDSRFEEIVDFSGIERFLDTPVKRYSSGMHVRLAFAVAAHLEPEILLIDEVLAVGDAEFQKKCVGKISDVSGRGRTVLFVSHNMGAVRRLCHSGLVIDGGAVAFHGDVNSAVAKYQRISSSHVVSSQSSRRSFGFTDWYLLGDNKHELARPGPVTLVITLDLDQPVINGYQSLVLQDDDGNNIAGWGFRGQSFPSGTSRITYEFPSLPVRPGIYYWYAALWNPHKVDVIVFPREFVISCEDHSDLDQAWSGLLNIPCRMHVR